jgi:hypothetical protein
MSLRALSAARTPLVAACLLGLALAPASVAAGAGNYERESEAAFEQQLAARQIRSAVINRRLQTVRVKLRDGRRVFAHYPKHQYARVRAELRAKRVAVTVLTPAQAAREAKKIPVHHKLRYIAGGVLLAAIVVVGALVLIRRRRQLD